MNNATVYLSKLAALDLAGASIGTLSWAAPNQGEFDDLALWSDSPDSQKFTGQAALTLEGTFFAPLAAVKYVGNGSQSQVRAQFIARSLRAGGNGALVVAPEFGQAVVFPGDPTSEIIH